MNFRKRNFDQWPIRTHVEYVCPTARWDRIETLTYLPQTSIRHHVLPYEITCVFDKSDNFACDRHDINQDWAAFSLGLSGIGVSRILFSTKLKAFLENLQLFSLQPSVTVIDTMIWNRCMNAQIQSIKLRQNEHSLNYYTDSWASFESCVAKSDVEIKKNLNK